METPLISGVIKKHRKTCASILIIVAVAAITFFWPSPPAIAQISSAPEIMVTWQTNSYVSPGYRGKAIPVAGSTIIAGVTVIDNGKVVPLGDVFIQWHLNNNRVAGGRGKTQMNFQAPPIAPNTIHIRATIADYKGRELLKTISIPMARSEVIIENPFINGPVPTSTVTLKARPFFFSTKDPSLLGYTWTVNNESPNSKENPKTLTIDFAPGTPPGSQFNVSLRVTNPVAFTESTVAQTNLRF